MYLIEKARLQPGMILGQDIYNFGQQKVIKKGTVLTSDLIAKLQHFSVLRIMIEEETVSGYTTKKYYRSAYSSRLQGSREFQEFQKNYEKEVQNFQMLLNDAVEKNTDIDAEGLYLSVINLLKDAGNSFNAFDMVQNLRHYDDETYAHSLNVGLLCSVMANWLDMKEEQHKVLTLAGILHDIGKTKIPLNIIQKPGKLSNEEYKIMKMHPKFGYDILSEKYMNYHIKNAALQHHERCDGSGYPNGLRGSEIDPYAKIVSIVDVYDAMTSPRVYRGPMCPFDVLDVLLDNGLQKYDGRALLIFTQRVAESYLNEKVRLSNGQEGLLVYIDPHDVSRPTVMTENGPVSLAEQKNLYIEEIL